MGMDANEQWRLGSGGQHYSRLLKLGVNCLDVDARKAVGGSVNVSRLFYSVLVCVCVES